MKPELTVGVVGNPNCGKTTVFNVLTGSRQQVGNWPGVTVEKKTGEYQFGGAQVTLVDLPGTYSLETADEHVALDEKVARDYVASKAADLIVNIVDAANIERNLYLTSQLLEMRVPMLVVLNMMDVVRQRGIHIDTDKLARQLDCPVIAIAAAKNEGLTDLKKAIQQLAQTKPIPNITISYAAALEQAITTLTPLLTKTAAEQNCDVRWLALRALEDDTLARRMASKECDGFIKQLQLEIEAEAGDEIDILAADARYEFVNQATQACRTKLTEINQHLSEHIDRVVLNRFLGIPIFLLVMYAMFMFTINIGSAFVDFFEQLFGAVLVDGLGQLLTAWGWPDWLKVLLAQGAGGGVQVVATFIPIVGCLFLFLSALEDSGYMARAAFVMDRFMRFIGLPGKSFVPMIVGFGCNVPAIMATRTLDNQRDRILTNLMNPFMSCGARLPVYALFAAAFFPVGGQNIVFSLYLLGILVAILTGLIMRHTLFKGDSTPFIMELPPYHLPRLYSVLLRTWDRLKTFIMNAGKVIVPMVLVLNFFNALGTDGQFGRENSSQSVLSAIGRHLTPAFAPMGIHQDNWPATVGIFTGVLAKEAVVGTLDALYGQMASPTAGGTDPNLDLKQAVQQAFLTIPKNLGEVADNLLDPLGINIGDVSDLQTAAEQQEVNTNTYQAMQQSFDGAAGAFAYLLFILLYTPCVTAMAAIQRETSTGWAVFVLGWTTGIAYMTATVYYQVATYAQHPLYSLTWIASLTGVFLLTLLGLWLAGRLQDHPTLPSRPNHDPI